MKTRLNLSTTAASGGWILGVAVVSVVIQCFPWAGEALQWQRFHAFPLNVFSALSGHLTHWSWDHLLWDVAAFVGLGFAALRILPQRVLPCLVVAALAIPIEIALFQPEFTTYRGLSGVDSALFGLLLAGLWRRGGGSRWLALSGLLGILAKTLFEWATGDTFFVERTDQDFIPVTSAHVVGFACGIVTGLAAKRTTVTGSSSFQAETRRGMLPG